MFVEIYSNFMVVYRSKIKKISVFLQRIQHGALTIV